MADKKKSSEELLLENEELKLHLAAKEALIETFRENENKYTAVYNSMSEGLAIHELIYDNSGKPIDYVIIDVNPAYEQIIGLKKKKAVGRKATEVYKVSPAPYLDIYSKVALTGDPHTFETYFPPLNKHFHVSVSSPGKGKFSTVFQDITERRQSEDKILKNEKLIQSLLDNVKSGVALIDEKGSFVICNPLFLKLFGLSESISIKNVNDQNWAEWQVFNEEGALLHVDDHPVRKAAMAGKHIDQQLVGVKLPSGGDIIWMLISAEPMFKNNGDIESIICTYTDITERRNLEMEREQLLLEIESRSAWLDASISSMAVGIILYGLDGKAIRMNETAKRLLPEELIFNLTIEERAKKLNWETEDGKPFPVEEIPLSRAMHGETTKMVVLVACFSDHKTFLSVNAAPIVDSNGKMLGVVASFLDITKRKKTEVALHESEERYHQMFDRHQAIGLLIEPEGGAIIDANPAALKFYGYTYEQLCSLHIQDINQLPPDEVEAERKKALKEQRNYFVFPHRLASGEMRWVEVYSSPLSSNGRQLLYSIIHDITSRKNAEESLRVSEERFSKAFKNSPNAITITRLSDGKIIDGNDSVFSLLGYNQEEVVGKTTLEFGIWADPVARQKLTQTLTSKGVVQNEEYILSKKDGTLVPVNLSASFITINNEQCFISSFIDLTERKKAEEALKISEERFRLALKNAPVSVAIQDKDLVYTWAYNQKTMKPDEIIGKTDDDLFAPEDLEWINPLKKSILESGKEMNVERWLTTNGQRLFLGIHYEPIFDSYGTITGIGAATIDLTDRKQAEESMTFQSRLLSDVREAVFSSDINFMITYWNKAAEMIFGWTKEEALGKNSGELLKPKVDGSSRDQERSKLRIEGHWEGEVRYIRKDGTYFIAEVNSTVLKDSAGKATGNVVIARDITERKKTEEELKKSEAWLNASISSMATGIILYGLDSKAIHMNATAKKLLPWVYFFNKTIGERSKIIKWHTEDGNALSLDRIPVQRALKGETVHNMVMSALINDQILWLSANAAPILDRNGKMLGVVASFLDITENKNAEIALRLSEERLRVTLSSIGDAVITVNTACKVDFLNKAAINLTGWETEEANGQPVQNVFNIINEITQVPAENIVQRVLNEDRVVGLSNHTSLITKDGRQIPIEDSAAPIKDQTGNIIGVILVFHDVTEKRRAQEALRESEERFRNLVKNAPTAIYEIDFTTRKFTNVNDSMCQLSGYTRDELLSIDSLELLDDESKKLFLSRISKSLKGEKNEDNIEYKVKAKDGRLINAVLNMKFSFNEKGIPVGAMVVGHDITERIRAEEALKESERRFRTLAENIPDLIVRFDKSLRFLYGNDAVLKRTGLSLEFLIGKTASEYAGGSTSARKWENAAQEVLKTGISKRIEQSNIWQDKPLVYDSLLVPEKDDSGNVTSLVAIARDISEMKKAENILRNSEQRLKYHLENSPLAVVEWDKDFHIIQWSNEAEKIFGLSKEEVLGVSIDLLNIIYPEDIPVVENTSARLMSGKELKVVSQNRNIKKSGEVLECIWYNSVLLDDNGEMNSVMSLVEDVTLLRKTERELIASQESYKELVTNARSMILKFDNEARFTFINEFALDFFGYKEEELLGESVMIVVPQKESTGRDLDEMVEKIIEDPDNHSININENIKKNGEKVWVEWHNKTLFDQSGKKTGHIAIGIDITKRRKAEEALMESERKLKSVLNAANESIYMFDREGHILMSNATGIRRLKRNEESEVVGHHFLEFMTPELAKSRMEKINEVFNTGMFLQYEDERNSRFFHHSFYPVSKDEEVLYVVTYSTDVTERKNAEINLKQSEDRFRTIAESITVLISITRISDLTVSFINEPFEKTFGFKKGELAGKRLPDYYYYPDDHNFLIDLLKVKGLVENMEVRVKKKDGTPFWIMTSVRKINFMNEPSYLTTSIDITETKKAQDELIRLNRTLDAQSKSSQAMMRSKNEQEYLNEICKIIIEDCGHAMVWVGYAQNDKHKSVRPVAHFGFDKGYIEQMNITWDDSERGNGPTGTAIKTGKPSICRNMLKDPCFSPWREAAIKRGYSSSVVLPLKSEEKAFGAISIYSKEPDSFTDSEIDLLSELADDLAYGVMFIRLSEYEKEATRAIKENEIRLKELIATKDKFFNIIAHDLKNPFTSLLGASELLYDNISQMTEENIKKLSLILNDSAKGGYAILQNLLDWSRSQTGQLKFNPEKANLKSIIDENIENLKLQVNNKEIDLKSDLFEDLIIIADKNMINTVLRNLLSNAVKYTFKNGIIRVIVSKDNGEITVTVKDTGIGISKEKADSLFKLENSLSLPGTAKEQGTGLGLKLCKEFTDKMGGRIWAESKVGEGSEFKFTIPIEA